MSSCSSQGSTRKILCDASWPHSISQPETRRAFFFYRWVTLPPLDASHSVRKVTWSVHPFLRLSHQWDRVTASRIAIIFFVFSLFHCVVQVVFQVQAFSVNRQAADFLTGLIDTGNATLSGFFVLGPQLRFCDHVPDSFSTESCQLVWNGTISKGGNSTSTFTSPTSSQIPESTHTPSSSPLPSETVRLPGKRGFFPKLAVATTFSPIASSHGQIGVKLQGFGNDGKNVTLDNRCLVALNWPVQT